MKKIVCIVGPTGVGKSGLSLKIASAFGNEIINGDSVQVYKKLDIGSAKLKDYQGIKHHLIDFLEPNEQYSVCDFQKNVRAKIEEIERPLIVGGTGLYVKAALYDYEFDGSKRDMEFEQAYANASNEELYQKICDLDENTQVDCHNRVRLLRALALCLENNSLSNRHKKNIPLYDSLIICLDMPRDVLYERINKRVIQMFDEGLVEEVKNLYANNIRVKAIGYNEVYDYLDGKITLSEAQELIQKNTRHYAKRQLTWYRHQMDCIMIDVNDNPYDKMYHLIDDFYKTSFRFAEERDYDNIQLMIKGILPEMEKYGWDEEYLSQDRIMKDLRTGKSVVALYGDEVIGYTGVSTINNLGIDVEADYFLGRVMVKKEHRHKHIATRIFAYLEKELKGKYVLLANSFNTHANYFYDKAGYSDNGIVKTLFGTFNIRTKDVK